MELSRRQKSLIRDLYTRHGRKKSGRCVCEGLRAVAELYAARPDLVEFTAATSVAAAGFENIPGELHILPESELQELAATINSQGILAVARVPEPDVTTAPIDDYILALDRVGDPGNFGTICRTARAAGLRQLWYTAGSVDPFADKTIRSALGAQFSMNLRSFESLEELRDHAKSFGYGPVYLTDPHQGVNCFTEPGLFRRTVLVIGSESTGVADLPGALRATIPMPGQFESLNAAQAATIFIFEAVRRSFPIKK